jgi:hypothetical protein
MPRTVMDGISDKDRWVVGVLEAVIYAANADAERVIALA